MQSPDCGGGPRNIIPRVREIQNLPKFQCPWYVVRASQKNVLPYKVQGLGLD